MLTGEYASVFRKRHLDRNLNDALVRCIPPAHRCPSSTYGMREHSLTVRCENHMTINLGYMQNIAAPPITWHSVNRALCRLGTVMWRGRYHLFYLLTQLTIQLYRNVSQHVYQVKSTTMPSTQLQQCCKLCSVVQTSYTTVVKLIFYVISYISVFPIDGKSD